MFSSRVLKKLIAAREKHTAQRAKKQSFRFTKYSSEPKMIWFKTCCSPSTSTSTSTMPSRKMIVERNHTEDDPQKTASALQPAQTQIPLVSWNDNFTSHLKLWFDVAETCNSQGQAQPLQFCKLPTSQDDAPRDHLRTLLTSNITRWCTQRSSQMYVKSPCNTTSWCTRYKKQSTRYKRQSLCLVK